MHTRRTNDRENIPTTLPVFFPAVEILTGSLLDSSSRPPLLLIPTAPYVISRAEPSTSSRLTPCAISRAEFHHPCVSSALRNSPLTHPHLPRPDLRWTLWLALRVPLSMLSAPVLPSFVFIGPRRLPGLPPSRPTNGFDSPVTPSHPWSTNNVECFVETFRCRESEKNSEADDCFGSIPLYRSS